MKLAELLTRSTPICLVQYCSIQAVISSLLECLMNINTWPVSLISNMKSVSPFSAQVQKDRCNNQLLDYLSKCSQWLPFIITQSYYYSFHHENRPLTPLCSYNNILYYVQSLANFYTLLSLSSHICFCLKAISRSIRSCPVHERIAHGVSVWSNFSPLNWIEFPA